MKPFLLISMSMVLIVSGAHEEVINGFIGDTALLPCACQNRNLDVEVRWQKETPKVKLLSRHGNVSTYNDNRVKSFLNEDVYNCSILLTNITAEDQAKYRCSFTANNKYDYLLVHLNLSANYSVCQQDVEKREKRNDRLSVKECLVEGRYRDTEIQWYLDGQLLTNSSTTKIIQTYTPKDTSGYTFNSTIITELSGTSEPICEVKAKGISANISLCTQYDPPDKIITVKSLPCWKGYFKIIPIVLVIGVSMMLLYRWKLSQGLQSDRHAEDNGSWS